MSFVGRNNAKISNRPSGGGNKLQGLAPKATFFLKHLLLVDNIVLILEVVKIDSI